MTELVPTTPAELAAAVQEAAASHRALEIVGGGTKRGVGHPQREALAVSMRRFDRVVDYDPPELVITVGAGTPLATIESLLAQSGQMLAFEPFELGTDGQSTIGGVVAAGLAGPRRVSAGSVRDHVLGFSAVSGRGEIFKAGGRVVKNVTGFDLPKLLCGSWGQLAALTEVTLKVVPRPRRTLTLTLDGLDDARAAAALAHALRSREAVAAAAYLPQGPERSVSRTLLRLEGFGPSVEARAAMLAKTFAGALGRLEEAAAQDLWERLRRAAVHPAAPDQALWRMVVAGGRTAEACADLRSLGARFSVDWGGGLLHAWLPTDLSGATVRALAQRAGGHALLLAAPEAYRARTPARHPEDPRVLALARRVRAGFDPEGILDPRRFEGFDA